MITVQRTCVILLVGFCQLLQLIKLAKCFFVMYGAPFVTHVNLRAFPCLMVFENFHDIDFGGETKKKRKKKRRKMNERLDYETNL